MSTRKSPSIIRIIWVDYGAYLGAAFTIVPWVVLAILLLFDQPSTTTFFYICIFSTIIGGLTSSWRIFTIISIFNDGLSVPGTVNNIWYFRDRGRVEYIYTFRGEKFKRGNAIHKSRYTRALESQDSVTVMVDRNNPKRSFIQELYL